MSVPSEILVPLKRSHLICKENCYGSGSGNKGYSHKWVVMVQGPCQLAGTMAKGGAPEEGEKRTLLVLNPNDRGLIPLI
jgi:hypothetical protein